MEQHLQTRDRESKRTCHSNRNSNRLWATLKIERAARQINKKERSDKLAHKSYCISLPLSLSWQTDNSKRARARVNCSLRKIARLL